MDVNTFAIYGVIILPIIIGLVQIFKKAGLPESICSLVALALGVAAGFISVSGITTQGLVIGLYLGVGAAGTWDNGKTILELLGISIGKTA